MEDDFVLIGWRNNFNEPIIVPKNIIWLDPRPQNFFHNGLFYYFREMGNVDSERYIIISQLYKLPNIRNLDLYDFLKQVEFTILVDALGNPILKGLGYTEDECMPKYMYYDQNKHTIFDIETNYPNLFTTIFVKDETEILF